MSEKNIEDVLDSELSEETLKELSDNKGDDE